METQNTDLRISEYSYSQAMSSNSSGIFPFSQTGPSVDPSGSAWDTTTAEGPQNFFADQGDSEEYTFSMGPFSGRCHTDPTDDFQPAWMSTAAAVSGVKTHKAEPMRRISSKGSATSHRITKPSATKSRPNLQTSMTQGTMLLSNYEMTGSTSSIPDALPGNGRLMDPSQFLFQQPNEIMTSPEMLYNRMDALPGTSTMAFNDFVVTHHVDPSTIPLDFETSLSGGSPTESFESFSEVNTPPRDDAWSMAMHNSPMTSVSSHSPAIPTMDNFTMVGPLTLPNGDMESSVSTVVGDDQVQMSEWSGHTNEGEARDHHLYKNAYPKADGLYHCPWEGQQCCNHRPEKLKCNYDKFVDSHLKPYRCKLDICRELKFSSTACLLRHEREAHGMHGHGTKPYPCTYAGCDRAQPGNGFPRKWNLHDHMHRVHNVAPPPEDDGVKDSGRVRKRKTDVNSRNASGRKSPKSRKSSPKAEPQVVKIDPTVKLREDWFAIQAGFPTVLSGFSNPDDPMVMGYINRARDELESMARIHMELMAAKNPGNYAQQSG